MLYSNRRSFLKTGAAVTTAGIAGLAGCTGGVDEDTLRFNFVVPIENLGSLLDIPEIQDQLDNLGDEYDLEVSQDASTPDSINSLAAGEADMALVTTQSFGGAVVGDAVPDGLTAIATDFWDAHPDHFGFEIYSLPDSDITEPEDLEGQTLGVNATGTGIHAVYLKMLQEVGLSEDDVDFQEQGFPTFMEGLQDGIFDAAIFPALFAVGPRNEDFTEVFTSHDAYDGTYPFAFTVATNNALDEKSDAVEAWGEDYVNVVNYMFENRDEVVSLAAEHFELPEEQVDEFFLTEHDYYRDQIEIDHDALQATMDELNDLGLLDGEFDAEENATNEYIEDHL
ncbi:ABC transporter substrate-binding protein [Natronorubrum sp. FCH18a]|uniref:ABC transporter substrate-binding protein n=1 Tax=Natronorubrum sp. FCH18a TaxID=3447018 RepID=UPI003F511931